ncbi:MAG TPA: family 1 glycosylhydrolase, partial [Anaerolineae bacterium]|nr:family 1 glycosylhydrolase [Anaerolineae bacterium]
MAKATFHFPPDFRWGTATAAHQVEGDNTNNDWWAWEQGHGHIKGGQKSGKASDWWGDGFEQDMDFAAQMNNTGHRMSIEWSRIEPREGQWDDMAIDHYRSMLKSMRARNIEPMITLHHFTNPIWLTERGGWETPEVVPLFERFVSRAVEALKDLCDLWITINEPNWYVAGGYLQDIDVVENNQPQGTFPPGKNDLGLALKVTDNMLLGHAAAYHAIHRLQPNARVGIAPNFRLFDPLNPHSRLDRFVASNRDRMFNQIVVDAVMKGKIGRPIGLARRIRSLKNTIDYLGVNYYTREFTRFTRTSADTLLFGQGT